MKVKFDSASGVLTVNGRNNNKRRMWSIKINATTKVSTEDSVVDTLEPCLVGELEAIIHEELRPLHESEGGIIRTRWEAMAR